MCPYSSLTCVHHNFRPSTQESLVSDVPKIRVSAAVASTRMPSGVHLRYAGGSWSQAFGASPSESVRVFSPPSVIALVHLRFGVHGNLQRFRVVLGLLPHRRHVGEDGVGLLGLLQGHGFLNPLEPIVHAVEDVPHRPSAAPLLVR